MKDEYRQNDNSQLDAEALLAAGWAALPASYRMPEVAPSLEEARGWCQKLAESHYENFHVASWFLPQELRPHFHALYAYCRVSDDLGDEVGNSDQALALLDYWEYELDACYEGKVRHPVFVVLEETIRQFSIPKQLFADLLLAFRHDQLVKRYETIDDLLQYCRYSANPVGRLVLYICGEASEEKFRLSDATCTALQLANFLQDVRQDYLLRGRIYLPQKDMRFYGVLEEYLKDGVFSMPFGGLMHNLVDRTRALFDEGLPLIGMVNRNLAVDLDLFTRGGLQILAAIENSGYDVLSARPKVSKVAKLTLLLRAAAGKSLPFLRLKAHSVESAA